jgi:predicted glycoside hydrolase/deacetylase ChbG (UPF0249 family)
MSDFSFVLCADDYGLSPAVSAGIRQALAARRINATGAMTNLPDWPNAAPLLAPYLDHTQIGVHLNLTVGAPLASAPNLAPQGKLPGIAFYLRQRNLPQAMAGEVAAEIARQFDAFESAMGRTPDFVDGHQHVHALRPVRGLLLAEMERRGWAGRLWLRDSADKPSRILARGVETKKALLLAWFANGFAKAARSRGFAVNEGFAGFSAFDPARDYASDFERYLRAPGPRHLVMCHPGRVDDALAALDPVTVTREQELDFLLGDDFSRALARAGASLGSSKMSA